MQQSVSPNEAAPILARAIELVGTDIEAWLDLFADDAVVVFPYAPSVGYAARLEGKAAIAAYFRATPAVFTELRFRDLVLVPGEDPHVAIAEVHGSAKLMPGAHPYEQDYVMILRTEGGKAIEYREYWNPLVGLDHFRKGAS